MMFFKLSFNVNNVSYVEVRLRRDRIGQLESIAFLFVKHKKKGDAIHSIRPILHLSIESLVATCEKNGGERRGCELGIKAFSKENAFAATLALFFRNKRHEIAS